MPRRSGSTSRHPADTNTEVEQVKRHLTFSPNQPISKQNGTPRHRTRRHVNTTDEDSQEDISLGFLMFVVAVMVIVLSFAYQSIVVLSEASWFVLTLGAFYDKDFLTSLVGGLLLAVCLLMYSWIVVYYDSLIPGISPPTPLSPSKYRRQSGHTFHLNYVMGILFSVVFLVHYVVNRNTHYAAL